MKIKYPITVLYVEDDELVRETVAAILVNQIETVYTAVDGQHGLELFESYPIDLIITDIRMPRLDGLAMSERIREQSPTIPIIVTTAFSDSEFLMRAIEQRIDKFLLKPIQMDALIKEIEYFSTQIQNERRLKEEQHRNAEYLKAIDLGSGVVRFDRDDIIFHVNAIFCNIVGFEAVSLVGKKLSDVFGQEQAQKIKEQLLEDNHYEGVIDIDIDSSLLRLVLSGVAIRNGHGYAEEYILFINDITDFLEMKEQLISSLYTHPLSGMPNGRRLHERLEKQPPEGLILIHLERVWQINALYGRDAGDTVIRQALRIIQEYYPAGSEIFQVGITRFAIIPSHPLSSKQGLRDHLSTLLDTLEEYHFIHDGIGFHITCTGVCVSVPLINLYAAAEMALMETREKRQRMTCDFLYETHIEYQKHNIAAYERVRHSIEEDRLKPYFQPIMSLKDGTIKKYEVLARIIEGDQLIPPGLFLEAAKGTSLYHVLTESILRQSLDAYYLHKKPFSINFSILDIDHEKTRTLLRSLAVQYAEVMPYMTIEITEEEGIENFDEVALFCKEMDEIGVTIAIDDFGKGYSNYDVITRLPIRFIKFDGNLIQNIGNIKFDLLIEKICEYAHANEIQTIAEFVDSEVLLHRIGELGVNYAQGYYISVPLPLEDIRVKNNA